jgi:hypothetical protein
MAYDFTPINNIDFDSLDWVEMLNRVGVKLKPKRPVLLGMLSDEERFDSASKYMEHMMSLPKLPKNYLRDCLEDQVMEGCMTSLDKAWIVLHVNRLFRDLN